MKIHAAKMSDAFGPIDLRNSESSKFIHTERRTAPLVPAMRRKCVRGLNFRSKVLRRGSSMPACMTGAVAYSVRALRRPRNAHQHGAKQSLWLGGVLHRHLEFVF